MLDKDVIKAALLRAGIVEEHAAPAAYEAFFAQADDLIRLGHSVILDNPVFWPSVEAALARALRTRGLAACAHRVRLRRRGRSCNGASTRATRWNRSRAPALDLTRHPGAVTTAFQPRLVLDTTRPLADLVDEALAYIDGCRLASQSPPRPLWERGSGRVRAHR